MGLYGPFVLCGSSWGLKGGSEAFYAGGGVGGVSKSPQGRGEGGSAPKGSSSLSSGGSRGKNHRSPWGRVGAGGDQGSRALSPLLIAPSQTRPVPCWLRGSEKANDGALEGEKSPLAADISPPHWVVAGQPTW